MTVSVLFSLLRLFSSVAAFLMSLIKLNLSIKFPTDKRQAEDNLLVMVVEGTGHMVLIRFPRCGSFILTMLFTPVLVLLSAVFMLILETQVSLQFVFMLFAIFCF